MAETANRQKNIFLRAIELPSPSERAAFLAEACAGDNALRQRVEAMLKAHAVPDSFLEKPAAAMDLTVDSQAGNPPANGLPSDSPGTRIGPYKLLEQIGEGGMGVVYMAEQQEPVRRTVALKIIKPGMDSSQILARFEAERQALALMDHPNIARVLDAGATVDGRPYFVMELVKGTPITKFCDERRLSPRERLELFVSVCHAIQHAHQKGVIHRDIKPSNVLVALYDDKPVPKVIDFGVAKATGQALTEKTLHTGFGAIIGTPEYMSPEQATFNQLDIDTRSDVYALGVLLYELLTGTTPVDKTRLKEAALLEVLRVVREEEPPRPSVKLTTAQARATIAAARGAEPDKLARALRGELDWIVMKSLEKDRNRRYESAASLGRDVDRYLKDELVEARPPSLMYRLNRFGKRHKVALLVVHVVGLLLIGWMITIIRANYDWIEQFQAASKAQYDAQQKEAAAIAAQKDTAKALRGSEGLRLLLQSELVRPSNSPLALLLAIEGAERHPGLLANNTLLAALDRNRAVLALPRGGTPLCFSRDGKRVLTLAGQDLFIWDFASGKELVQFEKRVYVHETPMGKSSSGVPTLPGHPPSNSRIIAAAFDRAGQRVLTTSEYGIVALWDAASGKQLAILETGVTTWSKEDEADRRNGHEYACPAQFSPDGRFVLTTYHKARLWDAVSGKEHRIIDDGGKSSVLWSEFSPDGKKIITALRDAKARIWEADTGKLLHELKGHATHAVLLASFNQDGTRAMTVASPGSPVAVPARDNVRLWDATTGKELAVLGEAYGSYSNPSPVAFTPDGARVLVDHFMDPSQWQFWDAKTGNLVQAIPRTGTRPPVVFSPNGKWLASAGPDGKSTEIRDAQTLELITTVGGAGRIWSPDSQYLATYDGGRTYLCAISGDAERQIGRWSGFLGVSPDGRFLATREEDTPRVIIWDLQNRRQVARFDGKESTKPRRARFSRDGSLVIVGCTQAKAPSYAYVGKVQTGEVIAELPCGTRVVRDVDVNAVSNRALTDLHGVLKLWDLSDGHEIVTLKYEEAHRDRDLPLFSADGPRFSADGRCFATGQEGCHVLYDARTGKEHARLQSPREPLGTQGSPGTRPVLSPDGRRTLTWMAFRYEVAFVWDVATGKELGMLDLRSFGQSFVVNPAFSADGAWIVNPSPENSPTIYDATTGKKLMILKGHTEKVRFVCFSPDKARVLTSSEDKTVRLWNAQTGAVEAMFHGHERLVRFAQFLPDGQVLSVDESGLARIWPVDALAGAKARAPRTLTEEERKRFEVPATK